MTKHQKLQYIRHLKAVIKAYQETLTKYPHRVTTQELLDDAKELLAITENMPTTD